MMRMFATTGGLLSPVSFSSSVPPPFHSKSNLQETAAAHMYRFFFLKKRLLCMLIQADLQTLCKGEANLHYMLRPVSVFNDKMREKAQTDSIKQE